MATRFRQGALISIFVLAVLRISLAQNTPTSSADRAAMATTAETSPPPYAAQTQKERLHYYFHHVFSVESAVRAAAAAGVGYGRNSPHEWHETGEGYALRFGSAYAQHIVQASTLYALSDVLHEDNRYFQSGLSGFGPRLRYAILSAFEARHADGSRHISISALSSYAVASAVSRSWQPHSTGGVGSGVISFGVGIAAETGFNVGREFLPSILRSHGPVARIIGP
jgi:hypothetical protein